MKSQKITDVDSAVHQNGRDNTSVQQKRQNVKTAKEDVILIRCADQWNENNTLKEQRQRHR